MQEADSLLAAHNDFNGSPTDNPITQLMGENNDMIYYVLHNKVGLTAMYTSRHQSHCVYKYINLMDVFERLRQRCQTLCSKHHYWTTETLTVQIS